MYIMYIVYFGQLHSLLVTIGSYMSPGLLDNIESNNFLGTLFIKNPYFKQLPLETSINLLKLRTKALLLGSQAAYIDSVISPNVH